MRNWLCFTLALVICPGLLQQSAAAQKPATAPAATRPIAKDADEKPGNVVIPAVEFENTHLSDVIAFLRDVDPTFQCVVSYVPGAEPGPVIQEMKLRNATVEAVLELLSNAYPQVEVSQDSSNRYWIIRVTGKPTRGGDAGEEDNRPSRVTVYRLRETVDDMLRRPNADQNRKKALEAIVSMVSEVVQLDGSDMKNARLQLHEATETLAVKGGPPIHESVGSALRSVAPTEDSQIKAAEAADHQRSIVEARLRQQTSELDRVSRALELASQKNIELERLLREAQKKSEPKPEPADK